MSHESAREIDINGYIMIEDNPISKVGVFPYTGAQIASAEQIEQGIIDPNKLYNVYRPAEELSTPECIESFKLLPFTDEHALLGRSEEGLTPAEKKGVQGVTGENVYFDSKDGYFKSNLKIFSEKLLNLIQNGKKELSIGYRCVYDLTSGVYNNIKYDAIQRKIRGNHLALVEVGRAGRDVAVLDHFKFTIDSNEMHTMNEDTKPTLEEAVVSGLGAMQEAIKNIAEKVEVLASAGKKEAAEETTGKDESSESGKIKPEEIKGSDESFEKVEDKAMADSKVQDEKKEAMDSAIQKVSVLEKEIHALKKDGLKTLMAEINQRNKLAQQLSHYVGAFDHSEKTVSEVAKYGIEKLGLSCKSGHEISALEAYFKGVRSHTIGYVADSAEKSTFNVKKILED